MEKNRQTDEIKQPQSKIKKKLVSQVNGLKLGEPVFGNTEEKTLHYTGLSNWQLLNRLFAYVKPHLRANQSSLKVCSFAAIVNYTNVIAALSVGRNLAISLVLSRTVSLTFTQVLGILYTKLKLLII